MRISLISLFVFIQMFCFAQTKQTAHQYIQKWDSIAIVEMNTYHIPASITLAQGILESGSGNSELATKANNHFGIKCKENWTGPTIIKSDDRADDCFRVYSSVEQSFRDHSLFLTSRPWYKPLFQLPINDYRAWAYGLKDAGYATNPKYADLLITLIERYELYTFDAYYQPKLNDIVVIDTVTYYNLVDSVVFTEVEITQDFEDIVFDGSDRIIGFNNDVKFTVALDNDSYKEIAKYFRINVNIIYKWNDVDDDAILTKGQIVYISKKKSKAETEFHTVKEGESFWSISQYYGIRIEKMMKRNNIPSERFIEIGRAIRLR